MCGIIGYIGTNQAAPLLLDGLAKLEYRGYDSAGIAVLNNKNEFEIIKACGLLKNLKEKTNDGNEVIGSCGIGHTRWATHGGPFENNAHPHYSDDRNVVLVHNGIIENYVELKDKLLKKGYSFYSDTDTEVAAKLVDYYYKKTNSPLEAISRAMLRIRGSYAFVIMFKTNPNELYVARKDSPLIIGKAKEGIFVASDVPAILEHARSVYYIDNLEMATIKDGEVTFYNIDREPITKELVEINWDQTSAEKNGYEHFMLKEIHEQPKAIKDTLSQYVKAEEIDLASIGLTLEELKRTKRIQIIGCGSAYHVGVVAKYVLEKLANVPVDVDLASEFRYRDFVLEADTLAVVISQSGETADSLAALRVLKNNKVKVLSIVNVVGSSIARESDYVLYTYAGPEISVATTKAYSTQLIGIYLLAINLAVAKNKITIENKNELIKELNTLPEKIEKILNDKERIQWFSNKFANSHDVFFLGRGIDYAIGLEGSLKMKEISYIHSEAYAAGELKHGTISLIENNILVIGILTQASLYEKTISNMQEVKSRGAYLMGVTTYGKYSIEDVADFSVYVPKTSEYFTTSLAIIPLQLLGYYISVAKGLDVDKPRNLAKSVTVE